MGYCGRCREAWYCDDECFRKDRKRHEEERAKQKSYHDAKKRVKDKEMKPGDLIMIQQRKTTTKPPWDPSPYTITEVKGSQVKAEREGVKR